MRTTVLFVLIAASLVFHGCNCDHVKPYTTFSTIDVQVGYREFQDGVQNVELFWNGTDVSYLAQEQCSGGGLISTAYAFKCEPDGHDGLKSPITKIEVISTTRFNEEHPAGTPLNDFVEMETTTDGYQPLNEVNNWEETYGWLRFVEDGEIGYPHKFSVRLTFEDGTVIEQRNEETVIW